MFFLISFIMNKFIKISVVKDGVTLFSSDMASPQNVMACLDLFNSPGTTITLEICELESSKSSTPS